MDPKPSAEPAPSKLLRALRWLIPSLVLIGLIVYFFAAEEVRRLRAQVELYYNIGFVAQLYAKDHEGLFPPLADDLGLLMYDPDTITPDLVTDIGVWFYPGEPGRRKISIEGKSENERDYLVREYACDQSYYYFGYFITNEQEARAFAVAYQRVVSRGESFDHDLVVDVGQGNFGGDRLLRLRTRERLIADTGLSEAEAIEFMGKSIQLIQNPRKRARSFFPPSDRSTVTVMYTGGNVASCEIPGRFPCTEQFFETVETLDKLSSRSPFGAEN